MMLLAEIDWPQTFQGSAILVAAVCAAYLAIRKFWQDIKDKQVVQDKTDRNGEIHGLESLLSQFKGRIVELLDEIKGLRGQITSLYDTIKTMQDRDIKKDETIVAQAVEVKELSKIVAEVPVKVVDAIEAAKKPCVDDDDKKV